MTRHTDDSRDPLRAALPAERRAPSGTRTERDAPSDRAQRIGTGAERASRRWAEQETDCRLSDEPCEIPAEEEECLVAPAPGASPVWQCEEDASDAGASAVG